MWLHNWRRLLLLLHLEMISTQNRKSEFPLLFLHRYIPLHVLWVGLNSMEKRYSYEHTICFGLGLPWFDVEVRIIQTPWDLNFFEVLEVSMWSQIHAGYHSH